MREAKPGLVLLYPANLVGAPGAFRGLHGMRGAKPGGFRGLHGMREAKPGGFQGLHACAEQNPASFRTCTACERQNPASFGACIRARSKTRRVSGLARRARGKTRRVSGFARRARSKTRRVSGLARRARGKTRRVSGLARVRGAKPGLVLLYPANLAGAPGAFRGRQGRLPSFPGYLVVTSPGPAGPLRQKIRGAPFLLCVGKRRPEGCSASTSRRRDRATSYVEILLRCCYCPSAQNSFEAMR